MANDHKGYKFAGYTAISGTTATLLGGANLKLPDNVKTILGIVPYLTSPAGNTAGEPVAAKVHIISDSVKINPLQVLAQPIGSSLLKSVAQVQGRAPYYPVNCPVKGGEELEIYGTGLFDHTIEPYMGCLVIYSDYQPREPQYFCKLGTFTNTGTAAATVSGSNIAVEGGSKVKEFFGFAVGTTVAALKGISGYFLFTSEGFKPAWKQYLPIEPASGQVDTNIQEAIAGIARKQCSLDMDAKLTISDQFHLSVALTTTGNFIAGVRYTGR